MNAQLDTIEGLLRRLVELKEAEAAAKQAKKAPKDIETPEQFEARLRQEFQDIGDFDDVLMKCREHYRIQRKVCRRDTIEKWFLRQRNWRREHGVPDEPVKKRGLVL